MYPIHILLSTVYLTYLCIFPKEDLPELKELSKIADSDQDPY
jgi:hypothetical protein